MEKGLSKFAGIVLLALVCFLPGCNRHEFDRGREARRTRPPANGQLMTLSADGTYLMESITNKPVFITGDSPQLLMLQISYADVETYLADRAARGFNALWVYPVDAVDQANAPRNFYGNVPFDGPDFTNEDPAYWEYVDRVLKRAGTYGITLVLDPGYVGLKGSPGYLQSYLKSSDDVITAYGTWLGNRYKNYNNIIWSLGGDADPSISGLYAKIGNLASGLASADPNHLITIEACRWCMPANQSSLDAYGGKSPSWLNLNWVYNTQPTVVAGCQAAYTSSAGGGIPPLMGEDWYEEASHGMTGLQVRQEGYWEVLSGCYLGRMFGNGPIWSFNAASGWPSPPNPTWQRQLNSTGSLGQQFLGQLMRSREHWKLVPDINHTVVTAGFGSGLTITTTARTVDGRTIIAYIPDGNSTTIAVDMTKITSQTHQAKCWWFNPTSGTATQIGVFPDTGSRKFTPPDSNDWVLVIDDVTSKLNAPGMVESSELKISTSQRCQFTRRDSLLFEAIWLPDECPWP